MPEEGAADGGSGGSSDASTVTACCSDVVAVADKLASAVASTELAELGDDDPVPLLDNDTDGDGDILHVPQPLKQSLLEAHSDTEMLPSDFKEDALTDTDTQWLPEGECGTDAEVLAEPEAATVAVSLAESLADSELQAEALGDAVGGPRLTVARCVPSIE